MRTFLAALAIIAAAIAATVPALAADRQFDGDTPPDACLEKNRIEQACARLGLNVKKPKLTTEHFKPPQRRAASDQLSLF